MSDAGDFVQGSGATEEVVADLSRPDVTTKYRAAADITNSALEFVMAACVEGADISAICLAGDKFIDDKVAGVYNKKVDGEKMKKGVAFPTCISLNEICGSFAPFKDESQTIKAGDLCKIDLGTHIDGFIAVGAHTVVAAGADGVLSPDAASDEAKKHIEGRKADVLMAARTAAEAALRTIRVGTKNSDVTAVINKAVEQFGCTTVRGFYSYEMKQHIIDGTNVIASKEIAEEKVPEFTFTPNQVFSIDIVATTGDGKVKETERRTTVFKRDTEQSYQLKTQLGRKFFHESNARFPFLPFSICAFEDVRMARAGVSECARHQLMIPYPVFTEKRGEFVAQFKFTVLLLPGGTKRVTGLPFDQQATVKSSHTVKDEELAAMLAKPVPTKSKAKKPKTAVVEESTGAKATDETVRAA